MALNFEVPQGATDAARDIAIELNEDVTRIRVRDPQWQKFLQEGVLVSIHIGRWRGRSQLTLEDLGIAPENEAQRKVYERILNLGSRYILPREVLKAAETIESRARYALEKRSFKVHWGRFIHKSKYAEWREVNDQIRIEYMGLRDKINEDWDELVARCRQDYVILGLRTYNDLAFKGAPGVFDAPMDEWVERFVARCMAQLWEQSRVFRSFSYDWQTEYIPLAAQVAVDQAQAQQIRLNEAERAILEDVRRTAATQAAEGCERLASDLISEVRTQVYDVAVDALEALKKGDGRLPRNSTRMLKNLIETISSKVFWSEPDLERRVANLKRLVEIPSEKRSGDELREALVSLGSEARLVLTELDLTPKRSAQTLGISDDLGDLQVSVRRSAGDTNAELDLGEIEVTTRRRGNNGLSLVI